MPAYIGKILIVLGVLSIFAGVIVVFRVRFPYLGRLPGDIRIDKDVFRFHFPIVTCIVLSLLLTVILLLIRRKF